MVEALIVALSAGLSIWASKEKTKYIDQLRKLKQDYREAISKTGADRDNNAIDRIEWELFDLAASFSASVGAKDA